jgi:hypothetical protein
LRDGDRVGGGTATRSAQTFSLEESLGPGDRVTAQQTIGGETSIQTPEAVVVQDEPVEIGPVGFATKLFECGECLAFNGLVPGADVEVRDGATTRGTGSSYDGNARVSLSQPMRPRDDLTVRQTACSRDGEETEFPDLQRPIASDRDELPPPTIEGDLRACERQVTVSGVYPGARVTLNRSHGVNLTLTACFDYESLSFLLAPPLMEGETLSASQEFPQCDWVSDPSQPVTVGPLDPVPTPGVRAPLCRNATTVTVTDLSYGAAVYVTVDTSSAGAPPETITYEGEAPRDGSFDFPIPSLPADAEVYAEQELCSRRSEASPRVEVADAPRALDTPVIPEPVFACATTVRVTNLTPGTRVLVYSEDLAAPIGERQVYDREADVTVAPALTAGDELSAEVRGCGHTSERSAPPVEVQELDEPDPPVVTGPIDARSDTIRVTDVVPGARVDIYVNGVWRGSATTGDTEVTVPVGYGDLREDDEVRARQWLCNNPSSLSPPVEVTLFKQVTKLTASDAEAKDVFGVSVSVDGDTVLVGASGEDPAGAAYVFERNHGGTNAWGEVAKLIASDGDRGDGFGFSVSVDGDTALVGAWGDDERGERAGAAYVYERNHGGTNAWGQVRKLTASDGERDDGLGWSVSVDGDTVVVGAWKEDERADNAGAAYIFE